MKEFVETVLGPVPSSELGRILTHEHLALDFNKFYVPAPPMLKEFLSAKIELNNVGVLKQYPYSSKYNVQFNDAEAAAAVVDDVCFYKKSGGGTIVENTNHGIKRDLRLMQKISRESGVHVVAGTGHYVALTQTSSTLLSSEEKIYDLITKELVEGCVENSSVKAGLIGEIGSSWPIEEFEKKAIRATAQASVALKCPVSFHPGRDSEAPFEILRIFCEAGGDPCRVVMSHLDRTLTKDDDLLEFSKLGAYCQFDLFGTECSYYQLHTSIDMPSDAQRIDKIKVLRDDGKLEKILMSHDIHTKHRLMNFGGHGFSHIIHSIFPKMLLKGFTQQEIDKITIENPRVWLTI